MRAFSFTNKLTFVILTSTLLCLSTFAVCNAATTTKYRRHTSGHHQGHINQSKPTNGLKFNVLDYGAKGDGISDDTKAFQAAWKNACKADASMIIAPSGYKFLVGPTSFSGSNCRKNIILQLDGIILAPTSSKAWYYFDHWLEFTNLEGFTIQGQGTFDGSGSVWWTKSIHGFQQVSVSKEEKRQTSKPTALVFVGGSKVTVTGITIQNSPQFHLTFDKCDGVLVHDISISSPGDSPNTDGIHLRDSKNVIIHHTNLACGDDCISIQTGCTNILVHDVNCGPGHGISIGSLGIDGNAACVSNIIVRNISIHGTMTGVRIKTWQGAKGLVRGVSFSNIQVSEVEVPIMIDQYYCDHSICENRTSAISIADVAYENIKGTYTVQPMHLSCSDSKPCMNLKLSNIELKPKPNGHRMSEPFCWQAFGELKAPIVPELGCLQEGQSSNKWGHHDAKCAA